jgi:5-methylcytosine-specific restriction protein A
MPAGNAFLYGLDPAKIFLANLALHLSQTPSHHPSYYCPMDLKRKGRKKPWMATKKGRSDRSQDGSLRKSFEGSSAQSNPLYRTAAWHATRDAVLFRDPLCVWCLCCGIATEATDADHIIPTSATTTHSDFYDQTNLVGSCRSCNSRRASYSAKGIYFETQQEWEDFLRRKHFRKITRT